MAISSVLPLAAAAPSPGPTPPADWNKAVKNVLKNGRYSEEYYPEPPTIGCEDISGPKSASHQANYMNLWGAKDGAGEFHTSYVTLVSEDWKLEADGNFHIDQWIHRASTDGMRAASLHAYLVETPDGHVVDNGNYPADPAEERANLEALATRWAHFTPPSHALLDTTAEKSSFATQPKAEAKGLVAPDRRGGFVLRSAS